MDEPTSTDALPLRRPSSARLCPGWIAVLLALAGGLALAVDVPFSRWLMRQDFCAFEQLCRLAEVFGHGLGVAVLVLAVWVLDPARRRWVPRMMLAAYGGGALANLLKLLLARTRPQRFELDGQVLDSFLGWAPLLRPSTQQSFPSAHTATAMGFAVALVAFYPRGRALFLWLVSLVALQRLFGGAHFLSDTLWGAAIGGWFACHTFGDGWFGRLLDRSDAWLLRAGRRSRPDDQRSGLPRSPSEPASARPARAA